MTMDSPVPSVPGMTFPGTLSMYQLFCQKVLPAVYDDSLSYYEAVCKVADYLNKTMKNVNDVNGDLQTLYNFTKQLQQSFEQFATSGFMDYYKTLMQQWLCDNMPNILSCSAAFVWLSLDDSGHILIHIPETWDFLVFSVTNTNQNLDNYGQLQITWDEVRREQTCPFICD